MILIPIRKPIHQNHPIALPQGDACTVRRLQHSQGSLPQSNTHTSELEDSSFFFFSCSFIFCFSFSAARALAFFLLDFPIILSVYQYCAYYTYTILEIIILICITIRKTRGGYNACMHACDKYYSDQDMVHSQSCNRLMGRYISYI